MEMQISTQKPTTIDDHQVCTMARVEQSSYRQHVVGLVKLASGALFQIHHHIVSIGKKIQQRNRRRHHHEQKPTTIDHHQLCTMARVEQSSYRQHVVGLVKLASGAFFQIHHHILSIIVI